MKMRALLLAFVVFACSAGACSLNPQPLPPGSYDAATAGNDATTGTKDAGSFGDAGAVPGEDAGTDGSPTLEADASDAASDAETDAASDAEADAPDGD